MEQLGDVFNKGLSQTDKGVSRREIPVTKDYEKRDEYAMDPKQRIYDMQFYSMYQYRMKVLKTRVNEAATEKWGDGTRRVDGQTIVKKDKILDISSGQLCWVSGTIFSDLKNKLNILNDVEKGVDDVLPKSPSSYVDGENNGVIMLEDESGRAILDNDEFLKNNILVTGCIVAVLGVEIQAGIFEIMDVVYPKISPQKPLPSMEGKIALVSHLGIDDDAHYDLRLELLKQYLCGGLGSDNDRQQSKDISRLVIAGNSVNQVEENDDSNDYVSTNNYGSKNTSKINSDALSNLDRYVSDLVCSIPVSIMPGSHDPVEICLPQQPLHRSFYVSSRDLVGGNNLQSLTNPAWLDLNGLRLLGTAGQNVTDCFKYFSPEMKAAKTVGDIMHASIKWQNIVPTAPDTLYCYPFQNTDPFVLADETPHVYFVGNQDTYASTLYEQNDIKVRLISIPKFSETGQFVVLDTRTLETEVVTVEA